MEVILTKENFDEEVVKSNIPVLVDFWATWCGPCRMIAPTLEEIAKEFDGKVKVGKINVDEQMELAVRFKIDVIPTLIYFVNGEITNKSIGAKDKNEIIKMFI